MQKIFYSISGCVRDYCYIFGEEVNCILYFAVTYFIYMTLFALLFAFGQYLYDLIKFKRNKEVLKDVRAR